MRFLLSLAPSAAFIGLILTAGTAFGQSLSLKKLGANYWIEASAPAGSPHTVQASENLHLWVDIQEGVEGTNTIEFDQAGVSERYFRLAQLAPPAPPIRVMILGDSLASDCCGWGSGLPNYFKPNADVINYAVPWQSTRVFLQSAEFNNMQLVKPDFVLIQFTWIDGSTDVRSTTPTEFTNNLRTIVQTIRGFNGVPILITMNAFRLWDGDGNLIPSDQVYNSLVRQAAFELNTPLIDLYQISTRLYRELGPSGAAFMRWEQGGPDDKIHFSQLGAVHISRLLTHYLPDQLGPYLIGIFDRPPAP